MPFAELQIAPLLSVHGSESLPVRAENSWIKRTVVYKTSVRANCSIEQMSHHDFHTFWDSFIGVDSAGRRLAELTAPILEDIGLRPKLGARTN